MVSFTILTLKAKNMARRLVAEPHSFSVRPKNIMHDVMETFGSAKYQGRAYVVKHLSETEVPETVTLEEQGHEAREHKRDIDDVLNDLNKITLKRPNIVNTTANIRAAEDVRGMLALQSLYYRIDIVHKAFGFCRLIVTYLFSLW